MRVEMEWEVAIGSMTPPLASPSVPSPGVHRTAGGVCVMAEKLHGQAKETIKIFFVTSC